MGSSVELVRRRPEGRGSTWTFTKRGLRWLLLSLSLALTTGVLDLAFLLGLWAVPGVRQIIWPVDNAFLAVGVSAAVVGLWRIRLGRQEYGHAHATNVKRGTVAFLLATVSALVVFSTGIILGYGFLPSGGYVEGATYPLVVTLHWVVQLLHNLGFVLTAAFVALFLLAVLWQLATNVSRGMAVAAFVLGVANPSINFASFLETAVAGSLPVAFFYASWALPAVSTALWLAAFLLVARRLSGAAPQVVPAAASG